MLDDSGQGGEQDEFSWSEPAVVGEAIARNSHSACIMLEGSMAGRMLFLLYTPDAADDLTRASFVVFRYSYNEVEHDCSPAD